MIYCNVLCCNVMQYNIGLDYTVASQDLLAMNSMTDPGPGQPGKARERGGGEVFSELALFEFFIIIYSYVLS